MKFSNPIFANLIWAGLLLESRLVAIPVILAGLIIEYFFVQRLTGFSVKRSLFADVTMNAVSLLVGIVLIPLVSFGWEISVSSLLWEFNNYILGSFHPINLAATFILAVLINAVIENFVLRRIFKLEKDKSGFRWLCLANGLSVGIALCNMVFPNQKCLDAMTGITNQWTRGAAATFIKSKLESAAPASSQPLAASW